MDGGIGIRSICKREYLSESTNTLRFIKKIAIHHFLRAADSEEEDAIAQLDFGLCGQRDAMLNERSEGGDARSTSNHHNRRLGILRETECGRSHTASQHLRHRKYQRKIKQK